MGFGTLISSRLLSCVFFKFEDMYLYITLEIAHHTFCWGHIISKVLQLHMLLHDEPSLWRAALLHIMFLLLCHRQAPVNRRAQKRKHTVIQKYSLPCSQRSNRWNKSRWRGEDGSEEDGLELHGCYLCVAVIAIEKRRWSLMRVDFFEAEWRTNGWKTEVSV